jgi:hypothetical protein
MSKCGPDQNLTPDECMRLLDYEKAKENNRTPLSDSRTVKIEQLTIFDEDKPLQLPEFTLKDGLTKDLIESKSTHPEWVRILTNKLE